MRLALYYGPVGVQTNDTRDYVRPVIEIQTSILSGSILREDAVVLAELLRIALKTEMEAGLALAGGAL